MGVPVLETKGRTSGIWRLTAVTKAGQQDVVMNFSPFSMRSTNSSASLREVMSAPLATSSTEEKPSLRRPSITSPSSAGNCPTMAGATSAVICLPLFSAASTSMISLRSITVPKGQARMQRPQLVHLSGSIEACPFSPFRMARTGHASSQGTLRRTMA